MTSSSGPITGKNSGIRSIGESTHKPAIATAILAERGTRGSFRRRRIVVTHAGSTDARSFAEPGGSRCASTIISNHETTIAVMPIRAPRINTRQTYASAPRQSCRSSLGHLPQRPSRDPTRRRRAGRPTRRMGSRRPLQRAAGCAKVHSHRHWRASWPAAGNEFNRCWRVRRRRRNRRRSRDQRPCLPCRQRQGSWSR